MSYILVFSVGDFETVSKAVLLLPAIIVVSVSCEKHTQSSASIFFKHSCFWGFKSSVQDDIIVSRASDSFALLQMAHRPETFTNRCRISLDHTGAKGSPVTPGGGTVATSLGLPLGYWGSKRGNGNYFTFEEIQRVMSLSSCHFPKFLLRCKLLLKRKTKLVELNSYSLAIRRGCRVPKVKIAIPVSPSPAEQFLVFSYQINQYAVPGETASPE
ncbi:hypothetical protein EK904_014404 [Melospiza melodia maxima]|nr:hypothetical protein EK904_014404 [Melospiza melodia maxima]